jgi:hypothetical protein
MKMNLIKIDKKAKNNAQLAIGKFSNPSKMPCYSWSIPASDCITGSKLAEIEGSVCFDCYAKKRSYTWPVVINALQRRLDAWVQPDFVPYFVQALQGEAYFRWFDSGDLQSLTMLEAIAEIANRTPHCQHWLPTKETGIVKEYITKYNQFPANLTVRISGYFIDQLSHSHLTGYGSVVVSSFDKLPDTMQACPAPSQDGQCKECRSCWNKEIQTIGYLNH